MEYREDFDDTLKEFVTCCSANTIPMQTVSSGDKRLEYRNDYDLMKDVFYDGQPFTGVLNDGNEITTFVNGNAHGDYYYYIEERIDTYGRYENGEQVESTSYYPSGKLKTIFNSNSIKTWSDKGALVMEFDYVTVRHYFLNGQLKSIRETVIQEGLCRYFAQNGDLVITRLSNEEGGQIRYEKALAVHYYELLQEEVNGLESDQSWQADESYRKGLIWKWFWEVFEQDKDAYFSIVNRLLIHPDLKVKKEIAGIIAMHKFEPYIEAENSEN